MRVQQMRHGDTYAIATWPEHLDRPETMVRFAILRLLAI